MSIEALFSDAVGTLFHVRGSVGGIYAEVARRYGAEVSPEILGREFREAMSKGRGPDYALHPRESWDQAEKDWWAFPVRKVFLGSGSFATSINVMPAKAGIQKILKSWIPAFAGMTY